LTQGQIQLMFLLQVAFVGVLFLHAAARARAGARRVHSAPPTPVSTPATRSAQSLRRNDRSEKAAGDGEAGLWADIEALQARYDELTSLLAHQRAVQEREDAAFRMRRREIALKIREHRRIADELAAVLPELEQKVQRLRAESEHLQRRRGALAAEVKASAYVSGSLRQRSTSVRREIAELQLRRDRLRLQLIERSDELRDLARRRAVIEAETGELDALLTLLQQLAD